MLEGNQLGLPVLDLLFIPLQALMTSREPGDDAVTAALAGRGFSFVL